MRVEIEKVGKAIGAAFDAMEADGLIERVPLVLGSRVVASSPKSRVLSLEFYLRNPMAPPYRVIGDEDEVQKRMTEAISEALSRDAEGPA